MNDKFDEFIEEVEQDMRQERYLKLWQKYGKTASYVVTGVLSAVALYMLYQTYTQRKQLEFSDKLLTAHSYLAEGKTTEALAVLEDMNASSTNVYGFLRDLQKAALWMADDTNIENMKKARDIYASLKDTSGVPPMVNDLALLLYVKAELKLRNKTEAEGIALLEPLRKDDSPWRFFTKETVAEILFSMDKLSEAKEIYAEIIRDVDSPEGIRLRAQLMTQVISQKQN